VTRSSVETKSTWFIYTVKGNLQSGDLNDKGTDGIPGREIVSPSDTNVIAPVPDHPASRPPRR